jgi:hypothetical protein
MKSAWEHSALSARLPPIFAFLLLSAALSAAASARPGGAHVARLPDSGRALEAGRSPDFLTRVQLAQLTIEQRVIIRIPAIPLPEAPPEPRGAAVSPPAPPPVVSLPGRPQPTREEKGPKCLKLGKIRGALINLDRGITMVTDQNEQFRAHFGRSCRAADFYSGFYIEPNKDGSLCAGRDMLHARNGSNCDIEKFSRLVPDD